MIQGNEHFAFRGQDTSSPKGNQREAGVRRDLWSCWLMRAGVGKYPLTNDVLMGTLTTLLRLAMVPRSRKRFRAALTGCKEMETCAKFIPLSTPSSVLCHQRLFPWRAPGILVATDWAYAASLVTTSRVGKQAFELVERMHLCNSGSTPKVHFPGHRQATFLGSSCVKADSGSWSLVHSADWLVPIMSSS